MKKHKTMTYPEALKAVKKGKTVTRLAWKVDGRFSGKIVPLHRKKPWLWRRTSCAFIFSWNPLEKPLEDLDKEHVEATDWIVCSRPS